MQIEFIGSLNQTGYYWSSRDRLKPIPSKTTTHDFPEDSPAHGMKAEELFYLTVGLPQDVFKEFLEILEPFYVRRINPNQFIEVIDKKSKKFNEDVYDEFKQAIVDFSNLYGADDGWKNSKQGMVDYREVGSIKPLSPQSYLIEALTLKEHVLAMGQYKNRMAEEIEDILFHHMPPKLVAWRGDWYLTTESVFSSIWHSFALNEDQWKYAACKWCKAPVMHRRNAVFCKEPRQCKNNYNNERRKLHKGGSK